MKKDAVKAGEMIRREAGEKLEGYRRRMAMANRGGGGISHLFQKPKRSLILR